MGPPLPSPARAQPPAPPARQIAAFDEGKQAAHAAAHAAHAAAHAAYAEAVDAAKAAKQRALTEAQASRESTIQAARRACDERGSGLKAHCGPATTACHPLPRSAAGVSCCDRVRPAGEKVGEAKARYAEGMAGAKDEHHQGMSAAKASHHAKRVAEQQAAAERAKAAAEPAQEKEKEKETAKEEEAAPAVVPGVRVLPLAGFPADGAFCIVSPTSRRALAAAAVSDPPVKWEGSGRGQWQKLTTGAPVVPFPAHPPRL
jgi:hypothetical protein